MSQVLQLRTARERDADTLDHVLDAAEDCIVESGLQGTTLARIAARARLSPANVQQRFGDREGLVQALMERHYHRLVQSMAQVQCPPQQNALDLIASSLEDWLLADTSTRCTRLNLELSLAAAQDASLSALQRRHAVSLIDQLSSMLRRLLHGHVDVAASDQEFQARVYAVAAMCGGLHSVMTSGIELTRMHLQLILRESLGGILKAAPV